MVRLEAQYKPTLDPNADAERFIAEWERAKSRIKVRKSFADTCTDNARKAHGLKHAAQVSPKQSACGGCPKNPANGGNCSFPDQDADATPGVTLGSLAYLNSSMQGIEPDSKRNFDIWGLDENLYATLMSDDNTSWPLDRQKLTSHFEYGAKRKRVKRRRADGTQRSAAEMLNTFGEELRNQTIDMLSWRGWFVRALETASERPDGFVMLDTLSEFARPSSFRDHGVDVPMPAWQAALRLEQDHTDTLRDMLGNIMRAHGEAGYNLHKLVPYLTRKPELMAHLRERLNTPDLSPKDCAEILREAGTGDIAEAISLSRFMVRCYEAIGISLGRPDRTYVAGLAARTKGEGDAASHYIHCQLGAKLPEAMASRYALILDGTFNKLMLESLTEGFARPPKIEVLEDHLENGPFWLNQYASICGDGFFEGDGTNTQSNLNLFWRFLTHEIIEARKRVGPVVTVAELSDPDDEESRPVLRQKHMLLCCTIEMANRLRALGIPDDIAVLHSVRFAASTPSRTSGRPSSSAGLTRTRGSWRTKREASMPAASCVATFHTRRQACGTRTKSASRTSAASPRRYFASGTQISSSRPSGPPSSTRKSSKRCIGSGSPTEQPRRPRSFTFSAALM